MTLASDPIKTLAAYQSAHRIVPVDGRCATDGIPVYRIRGGTYRHDQWEITKLTNAAGAAALERSWFACDLCGRDISDGLYQRFDFGKAGGVKNVCSICVEKADPS